MIEQVIYNNHQGERLCGILNNGRINAPLLLFVHGFTGNKDENGLFVEAEEYFSQRGFNTFRFDMSGSGDSKGDFQKSSIETQMRDLEATLGLITEKYPANKIGIVGFSLGAAVALLDANPHIDAYALWSPAIFLSQDMFPKYATEEIKKELVARGFIEKGGLKVGPQILSDLGRYHPEDRISTISQPVLLVHGTKDPRLDYTSTVRAKNRFQNATLTLIPEANHSYKQNSAHRQQLFEETYSWFRNQFQ